MERRQQYLLGGLIGLVVLWFGSGWLNTAILEPIRLKQDELTKLKKRVSDKELQLVALAKASGQLREWKGQSLPPDGTKSAKQKPDALNAQRLYLEWLTDLTQESGFEDVKVSPDRNIGKGNLAVSVFVKIEADARFQQLCQFFDRFYRADLLHRIASLRVTSREYEGDPFFQVVILAEGMAMVDAPQRRSLFPKLGKEIDAEATTITLESLEGFGERKAPFHIRVADEILKVTAVKKTEWTVERGIDGTVAASVPAGAAVEILRKQSGLPDKTSDQYKELLAANVFVKPAPPFQYRMRFPTLGEKIHVRGSRPFEASIAASGYDSSKGKPEYALTGKPLPGMELDKATGKLTWQPEDAVKADKYLVSFEAKHSSAPGGKLVGTLTILFRNPNTPPKFDEANPPVVFLGRDWTYKPTVKDNESPVEKLTWKIDGDAPAGLSIESSTGKISWTPADSTPIGPATVKLLVTDDGTPPQSGMLELKLDVRDDVAIFTKLTGIFSKDNQRRAILFDQSQNKSLELFEGDSFTVADVKGTISSIANKFLLFASGDEFKRLELGQHLREAKLAEPPVADATKPANASTVENQSAGR